MFYEKNSYFFYPPKTKELCPCCSGIEGILRTVIIGSFRKHLKEIQVIKQQLVDHHIKVLSPIDNSVIDPSDEFIVFESDPVSDPKLLQDSVFARIRQSSFLVVANIDGYIGQATLLEIGYAIALGIDIFTFEPVESPHLKPYCNPLSELFQRVTSTATFLSSNTKSLTNK